MPRRSSRRCATTRGHDIGAVFVVHTDTASGITTDIGALRRALDAAEHPALLVVDVVASLGAAPFAMDALGVDVALGASQKGLMCPPGVGFLAVNAAALCRWPQRNPAPRFYWDWVRRSATCRTASSAARRRRTCCCGLEAALGLIFSRRPGRGAGAARAAGAARCTRRWRAGAKAARWTSLRSDPAARSVSVTTIQVRRGHRRRRACARWRASVSRSPSPAAWVR